MTLITEDTGLHAYQVIHRSLLPIGIIALLLELLCLQEIAWIIFVTDRERYEMKLFQAVDNAALTAHRHHLQNTLLGAVITVLGPTLALGYPDVLVLLLDGKMHIVREALARHQHLSHAQGTLYDKRLVDTYQVLDPRKRKEIITDGNLTGGLKPVIDKKDIENG